MSTLLLIAPLPIPPSVNSRTIISARGGTMHPDVRQFYADAHYILLSHLTTVFPDEIVAAREREDFLSVTMWFYLPEASKAGRSGTYYLSRDLDNCIQMPMNSIKQYLGIDDKFVVDLNVHKRPLVPPETEAYCLVSVSAVAQKGTNDDCLTASLPQAFSRSAVKAAINDFLATIEPLAAQADAGTTGDLRTTTSLPAKGRARRARRAL